MLTSYNLHNILHIYLYYTYYTKKSLSYGTIKKKTADFYEPLNALIERNLSKVI